MKISRSTNRENDGRRFEGHVKNVAVQYHFKKILRLEKCDPPTRVIGPSQIIYMTNPFADFVGTWTERGGRALMIEVKSTQGDKLTLGNGKLTEKQIDWLVFWHQAGAAVGVIWESDFRVGFLPIGRVKAVFDSGRRHIKFEEVDPIPQGTGMILFDFVQNLRHWYPDAHGTDAA